ERARTWRRQLSCPFARLRRRRRTRRRSGLRLVRLVFGVLRGVRREVRRVDTASCPSARRCLGGRLGRASIGAVTMPVACTPRATRNPRSSFSLILLVLASLESGGCLRDRYHLKSGDPARPALGPPTVGTRF